jgi:threonine/homoserine/homoserine lactone efflux protein
MPILPSKLALFVGASLALTLTPGPAVLFIVARSMSLGRRAGFLSVLGVGLGNTVHAAAAALGLAAVLASSPVAFAFVRYLGAGYLVLLGVRRMLDRGASVAAADIAPSAAPPREVLRQAFTVAVLNPKTALFFLAFLPQFAIRRARRWRRRSCSWASSSWRWPSSPTAGTCSSPAAWAAGSGATGVCRWGALRERRRLRGLGALSALVR